MKPKRIMGKTKLSCHKSKNGYSKLFSLETSSIKKGFFIIEYEKSPWGKGLVLSVHPEQRRGAVEGWGFRI